jgi:hypothetical protein
VHTCWTDRPTQACVARAWILSWRFSGSVYPSIARAWVLPCAWVGLSVQHAADMVLVGDNFMVV